MDNMDHRTNSTATKPTSTPTPTTPPRTIWIPNNPSISQQQQQQQQRRGEWTPPRSNNDGTRKSLPRSPCHTFVTQGTWVCDHWSCPSRTKQVEEENDNKPKSETKTRYHHFYQETLSCPRVVTNSTIRSWSGTMSGNDSSGTNTTMGNSSNSFQSPHHSSGGYGGGCRCGIGAGTSYTHPSPSRSTLLFDTLGEKISLNELVVQKRRLKMLLKQYDLYFYKQHGRMPNKLEKEKLRHLYEMHNLFKHRISILEEGKEEGRPLLNLNRQVDSDCPWF